MASGQASTPAKTWSLSRIAQFAGMRVLAWDGDVLYASRGYALLRAKMKGDQVRWELVARYRPEWWRSFTSHSRLGARLCRDGFHALAVMPSGHIIAALPGAIATLQPGETEFRVTHRVLRGTRPLHIAVTPENRIYWGEYFDNAERCEVHVYASDDRGATWNVAYTFGKGEIRHVHNIVADTWENCLWMMTGDNGEECRVLRVSHDFRSIDVALSGNQQARAVAMIPARDGIFFSSDTPLEKNHVYHFDRHGELRVVGDLDSSSIYGCSTSEAMFFSTMVEPSEVNHASEVAVYGSADGFTWHQAFSRKKDGWPMRLFQYGNAYLPDGVNATNVLAVTTVAVADGGFETSLWRVLR
jgi:hypothetical protein